MDPFISATELAALLSSRQVSAVEAADFYLDRIDAINPRINAIVWIDRDDVRRRALEADRRIAAGTARPFEGVPIPIKDLTPVAGQPYTASSLAIDPDPAEANEVTVDLLEDAGFVLFGRSNSPEFGPLTVSENRRWGKTRNPWNPDFTSGGSSGGASAAVAAALAPVAHASDGGGSIRVPSAATGLIGLKPSRGRVPNDVRGWEQSVTEGAITRTVADAAAMLDVLGVADPLAWYSAPPKRRPYIDELTAAGPQLRVGLLLAPPTGAEVDDECVVAALKLARTLEHLGHSVEPADPFLYSDDAVRGFADLVISASVWATPFDHANVDRLDPYIRYRFDRATTFHAGEYVALANQLQWETRRVVAQWGRDFDILLTPTTACQTPRVGAVYDEANETPDGPRLTELRTISFTSFVNIAGLPAISLPVHAGTNGMPIGAQLIGGAHGEATLLRVAAEVEQAFDWQLDRAPLAQHVEAH
ncbi:amidase [Microbacterium sp. NPDC058062]|uniref:amidase n=1 Tax=Microbacterium sp. NPDC058062 TaxID=3346320 RepID=UPI0036DA9FA3